MVAARGLKEMPVSKVLVAPGVPDYGRLRHLIRDDIVEGLLAPGSRLKVAELAQRYNTSTIPVREALQQLQGEGIVTFVANRGASVRPIDEAFIRNIHEVRALAEPYLATWFIRHHTDEQLAELEDVQRLYDEASASDDRDSIRKLNRRFHSTIYNGHYNEEALAIAYRHSDLIMALSFRFPQSRARVQTICREHWQIIDAIRNQDENELTRVIVEHVRGAGQNLIELMRAAERRSATAV